MAHLMTHDLQRTDLYRAFIGKARTAYYLKQFAVFDEQGGGFYPSWNWAAFFFGPFWVQYRKLHGLFWALLLVALLTLIAIGQSFEILGFTFLVACLIGLGAYANAFYYRRAKKMIAKVSVRQADRQQLLTRLKSKAGVSSANAEILAAVLIGGAVTYIALTAREDYTIRYNATAAVSATAEIRKAIEALVKKGHTLGALPLRFESIPTAASGTYGARYVSSVSYDEEGVVTITLADHERLGAARNETLIYVPQQRNNRLTWELSEKSTVPPKYRPKLSAWWPHTFKARFQAIRQGADREEVIAELGEPKTTTPDLFLRQSNGERSAYRKLPGTTYYLLWEHRGGVLVVGFDKNDRSTEKLDGLRFP
jgi:hypothetical protein